VPDGLPLILPADEAFDGARFGFNGMIDRRPTAIARPRSEEEVLAALAYAVDADLAIAVRGGGHSVAGHSCCDGGLLVDLRAMRTIEVDTQARRVRAQGGTTWREFDPACQAHGLAMPGGTFDTTGIAGLTLGGGIGYLIGAHGLTLDNLVSARVATLDGEVVTASADEEPELFWALRGGGGNFGVVTSFEYRLHPLSTVYGGVLLLPFAKAHDGLRAFRELMDEAPDEFTAMALLGQDDTLDEQTLVIYVCFIGADSEGQRHIEALRRLRPLRDDVRRRPYLELQRIAGELPFGLRHYWKSHFLRELPDEAIALSIEHFASRAPRAHGSILIEPFHGAARRVPLDDTAWNERSARYNASCLAIWDDPADDDREIAWSRAYAAAIEPWCTAGGGGYLNYGSPDEPVERIRAAFGEAKFARLQHAKRRWDPDNRFRFNSNIPLD
jgi:FAD/FMN-containing dehydrogenase